MNIERIWPDWTIEEQLGKGSYGTVYRIRKTTSGSGRAEICSALKVIRIPASGSEIEDLYDQGLDEQSVLRVLKRDVELLENEIRVMISLAAASGIVKIEDYYIEELTSPPGYVVYIRMELLESLTSYVRRKGELTQEEALKMTSDLCEALSACESRNVIHRDIKPANIFRNEFGQFKLGDFGVAKQMEGTVSAGTRVGTPSFEAPEIFLGNRYDHTVDIYGLGIVLYTYLNKGRKPFYPPYPQDISREDMQAAMEKRLSGEPVPKIPGVDKTLFGILQKACAYRPEDRYPNAEAFRKDLERYSRGEHFIVSTNGKKPAAAEKRAADNHAWPSDSGGEDGTFLLSQNPENERSGRTEGSYSEKRKSPVVSSGGPTSGKGGSGKTGLVIGIIGAVIVAAGGALLGTKLLNRNSGKGSVSNMEEEISGAEKTAEKSSEATRVPATGSTVTKATETAKVSTNTLTPELTKEPVSTPTPAPEPTKAPASTPTPAAEPTKTPASTPTPAPEPTKAPAITPIPTAEPAKAPIITPTPIPLGTVPPLPAAALLLQSEGTETSVPTESPVLAPAETPLPTEPPVLAPAEMPLPTEPPVLAPAETPVPTETSAPAPKHAQFSADELNVPLFSSGLTEEEADMQIPNTAFQYEGHSYFIFDTAGITSWENAQEFCIQMGGYLAVIGSQNENKELFRYASAYMDEYGAEGVFFGFSDFIQEGTWEWVPQEASDFVNWYPGQPNGGTESNYCEYPKQFADGSVNTTASWSDTGLIPERNTGFICEWPGVS